MRNYIYPSASVIGPNPDLPIIDKYPATGSYRISVSVKEIKNALAGHRSRRWGGPPTFQNRGKLRRRKRDTVFENQQRIGQSHWDTLSRIMYITDRTKRVLSESATLPSGGWADGGEFTPSIVAFKLNRANIPHTGCFTLYNDSVLFSYAINPPEQGYSI